MGIFGVVLFFGAYFLLMLLGIAVILRSMLRRRQLPLFQTLLTMAANAVCLAAVCALSLYVLRDLLKKLGAAVHRRTA